MEALKEHILNKIVKITKRKIDELTQNWLGTFEHETAVMNLHKLVDHCDRFFTELLEETKNRRITYTKQIKELMEEYDQLKRRMNTDVDLVDIPANTPLLTQLKTLEASVKCLHRKFEKKEDDVERLLDTQTKLCAILGYTEQSLYVDSVLPDDDQMNAFQVYLNNLEAEQLQRLNTFLEFKNKIVQLSVELDMGISDNPCYSYLNDSNPSVTLESLKRLENLHNSLSQKREKIQQSLNDIKSKLYVLWDFLEIDETVKANFNSLDKCSLATQKLLLAELNRCQLLKRQNVKQYIERTRKEISDYWNKMKKTECEREEFVYFKSEEYTEALLTKHEIELKKIKKQYEANRQFFEKYDEYKYLLDSLVALEVKENEPGRFNNRGGKLLKEEKERKTIAIRLPKLKAELSELANEYKMKYGKSFLIWGVPIESAIPNDIKKRKTEKEHQLNARRSGLVPVPSLKIDTVSSMKRVASGTCVDELMAKKQKFQCTGQVIIQENTSEPSTSRRLSKSPAKRIIDIFIEPYIKSHRYGGKVAIKLNHPTKKSQSKSNLTSTSENQLLVPAENQLLVPAENQLLVPAENQLLVSEIKILPSDELSSNIELNDVCSSKSRTFGDKQIKRSPITPR